ncbi:hypothetical protein D3C73_1203980 [compost metagenome]
MGAGQDGRVACAGHGHAVGLIAVDRDHALIGQGLQPAGELAAVLVEEIGAELVDHHGDDQRGRGPFGRRRRDRGLGRRLRRLRGCVHGDEAQGQAQGGGEKAAADHRKHQAKHKIIEPLRRRHDGAKTAQP